MGRELTLGPLDRQHSYVGRNLPREKAKTSSPRKRKIYRRHNSTPNCSRCICP